MALRLSTFLIAAALVGCFTGQSIKQLELGMTRQEVVKILGKPDGVRQDGEYEALGYTNRMMGGWSPDRADYSVILRDGRVVEYGAGKVRQTATRLILFR